jgi:hypothetical protein
VRHVRVKAIDLLLERGFHFSINSPPSFCSWDSLSRSGTSRLRFSILLSKILDHFATVAVLDKVDKRILVRGPVSALRRVSRLQNFCKHMTRYEHNYLCTLRSVLGSHCTGHRTWETGHAAMGALGCQCWPMSTWICQPVIELWV